MPDYDDDVRKNVKVAVAFMLAVLIYFMVAQDAPTPPHPVAIQQVK